MSTREQIKMLVFFFVGWSGGVALTLIIWKHFHH
jgi:hypothetical protein